MNDSRGPLEKDPAAQRAAERVAAVLIVDLDLIAEDGETPLQTLAYAVESGLLSIPELLPLFASRMTADDRTSHDR